MDYTLLRKTIKEKYRTEGAFAEALGIDRTSLYAKLINKTEWKREEIEKACLLLDIPINEVHVYFFKHEVEKTQAS